MKSKYDLMERRLFELETDLEQAEDVLSAAFNKMDEVEAELFDAEDDLAKIKNQISELEYLKQGNP
jgi:chromosome segregation ATPase